MSREVRRVPANWEHPTREIPDWRTGRMVTSHQPMFDRPYGEAINEWIAEYQAWDCGERPSYCDEDSANMKYWEWNGGPPDPAYYRPDWAESDRTHLMMYESTSEGTPISPAFSTPEELARWLVDNNANAFGGQTASYEGWLRVAGGGYACSTVVSSAGVQSGVDGLTA
jgi:hypothetical protein